MVDSKEVNFDAIFETSKHAECFTTKPLEKEIKNEVQDDSCYYTIQKFYNPITNTTIDKDTIWKIILTYDNFVITLQQYSNGVPIGHYILVENITFEEYFRIEKCFYCIPDLVVGEIYQCILRCSKYSDIVNHGTNLVKIIKIEKRFAIVTLPNHINQKIRCFLQRYDFKNFKLYNNEQLQNASLKNTERSGSSPINIGCNGSIVTNSKRLTGYTSGTLIDDIKIELSFSRQTGKLVNQ